MKKKLFIVLLSCLAISGCGETKKTIEEVSISSSDNKEEISSSDVSISNSSTDIDDSISLSSIEESSSLNEDSSSIEEIDDKDYYATINSPYDQVNIYGIVGETFDLSTINTKRVTSSNITYTSNGNDIEINGDKLKINKKGIYEIKAKADGNDLYKILLVVNDNENSRYDYPLDIDYSNGKVRNGNASNVTYDGDAITVNSPDSSVWTRVTYNLDKRLYSNYTVECDATILSINESSRWFGIIFNDQETNSNSYPYYQFDIRQKTSADNAIEITNVYGNDKYTYLYSGKWQQKVDGDLLKANEKVHMKIEVNGQDLVGTLNYLGVSNVIEAKRSNGSIGNFGFQASGCKIKFENIRVILDKNNILSSTAKTSDSLVDIDELAMYDKMKPSLISSATNYYDLICLHESCQQYYVVIKNDKCYDIYDNKMDESLNELIEYTRGFMIPNIQIEDEESLKYTAEILKSYAIADFAIYSHSGEILQKAKDIFGNARLGYIPTDVTKFDTYSDVAKVCREAGQYYANMVMLDSNIITKEANNKATSLGYTLVANAKDGKDYSLLDGALDGCKLILAKATRDSVSQANLLFDDTVFDYDDSNTNLTNQTHSLLSIPVSTGHRGAGTNGSSISEEANALPENTIPSFEYAYNHGAQAIELDIHMTIDGKLAIIHDDNTSAYSTTTLTVRNSTLKALQSIPLKLGSKNEYTNNIHIPSLEEFFEYFHQEKYKDKAVVIEIKDTKYETGVAAINLAKSMYDGYWYDRITFISFGDTTISKIKAYDPSIQSSYLNTVYRTSNAEYWSSFDTYLSKGIGLASQYTNIDDNSIQESNARGQIYWLWTFGPGDYAKLASQIFAGNRAFTTNYIDAFGSNKYKLVADDNITISSGSSKKISATSKAYDGTSNNEDDIEIIILSNNAKANKNVITRTGDGTIYAIYKLKTKWYLNASQQMYTNMVIYSDIVAIH